MEQINIARPFDAFSQHISSEENQRILFSAPFGSGKTYFLREYFKAVHKTTNAFWLSPVKYVVSPNEDIFEYIKYDLASQLLDYPVIKEDLPPNIGVVESSYKYIVNNPKDIFKLLFSAVENAPGELAGIPDPVTKAVNKAGKFGKEVIDTITKYQEYTKRLGEQSGSTNQALNDYLDKSIEIKGSVFEDDLISQMIRVALSKVRALHQQNVLIVDDLDRLDPEHIFRILNILSVHQDFVNGGNKFGFDKIIVVCDLDNIRKIYEHKYGEKVDFRGYIEKFYSTSVFKFSNTQALAMYCQSDLTNNLSYEARTILGVYLNFFVNADKAKVRSIIKHRIKTEIRDFRLVDGQLKNYNPLYQFVSYGPNSGPASYENGPFHIDSSDFEIIPVIKILINIFGGFQELLDVIKGTQNSRGSIDVSRYRAQAIKVLGPLQFLTENMNTPEMLTAIVKEHPEYPNYTNYKLILGPSFSLYGITIPLTLKWNKEQLYTDDQSFYYNEIGIVDMDIIRTQIEKTHKSNLDILKMNDLLSTLDGFLNFFRNQDFEDMLA